MPLVFFDKIGMAYDHDVSQRHFLRGEHYSQVPRGAFKRKMTQKRSQYATTGWILHQNNAPALRAHITKQAIDELGVEIVYHPSHSPDLHPCGFYLFPEARKELHRQRFAFNYDLHNAVMGMLDRLSKRGSETRKWIEGWYKCMQLQRDYFKRSYYRYMYIFCPACAINSVSKLLMPLVFNVFGFETRINR